MLANYPTFAAASQQTYRSLTSCVLPADKELAAVVARNGGTQVSSGRLNVAGIVSHRASRKGGEAAVIRKGMVLPFEPLSLTFRHMDYYVDMPAVRDKTPPYKPGQLPTSRDCSGLMWCSMCGSLQRLVRFELHRVAGQRHDRP